MKNPFTSLACLIVRRFGPGISSGTASRSSRVCIPGSNEKLSRELMELGGGKKNCIESYYVNKIAKFLEIAALCLAVLAVVLIIAGIKNGGMADVLAKATAICMECVGLG